MRDNLTNILASCLQAIEQGGRTVESCLELYPEHREALQPLLDTATALKARADFAPRPGFREASRRRLVKSLPPRLSATPGRTVRETGRQRLSIFSRKLAVSWIIIVALVATLLSAGTVYAANTALPGDVLYPVKLSIEDFRLFLADDAEGVVLATEFLQIRIDEIHALLKADRGADLALVEGPFTAKIAAAVYALANVSQTDAERAARLAMVFEEALTVHTEVLTALLDTVPDQAKPALERAISSSSRGQEVVRGLFESDRPGGGVPERTPGPPVSPPGGGKPDGTPTPPVDLPEDVSPEQTPDPATLPPDTGSPDGIATPSEPLPDDVLPEQTPTLPTLPPDAGPPDSTPTPPEPLPGDAPPEQTPGPPESPPGDAPPNPRP